MLFSHYLFGLSFLGLRGIANGQQLIVSAQYIEKGWIFRISPAAGPNYAARVAA
jgi:hypothetical protein